MMNDYFIPLFKFALLALLMALVFKGVNWTIKNPPVQLVICVEDKGEQLNCEKYKKIIDK